MLNTFFFDSWKDLLWIFLMSLLIYPSLVAILRAFGKRTLTNVNMFDFIITVAYGNALSSIIITKSISYEDGFMVLFMMTVLQVILSMIQMLYKPLTKLVKSKPIFLFYQGRFNEVEAITLEGDGTLAVMGKGDNYDNAALEDVIWLEK